MDRSAWLQEMRRDCEEKYDVCWAPTYDENVTYGNLMHQQFIQEFLSFLPQDCNILDAACGTGRYLPFLIQKTQSIVAIDQAAGMPVVYGEWPDDEEVYYFHPTNQQVRDWVQQAGFEILREAKVEIYYHHVLSRKI